MTFRALCLGSGFAILFPARLVPGLDVVRLNPGLAGTSSWLQHGLTAAGVAVGVMSKQKRCVLLYSINLSGNRHSSLFRVPDNKSAAGRAR